MNTYRLFGLAASCGLIICLNGCATITKSSAQAVTVNTRPAGAECTLTREGSIIAAINPTPGTISVQKDKDPITVQCHKDGYLESSGTLASEFEAMTFGNIIFGGLIGVGVDAASGAMSTYPPLVTITLIPDSFPSMRERDAFFDRLRDDFIAEADKSRALIAEGCLEEDCESQLAQADEARKARLAEIESMRSAASIVSDTLQTGS